LLGSPTLNATTRDTIISKIGSSCGPVDAENSGQPPTVLAKHRCRALRLLSPLSLYLEQWVSVQSVLLPEVSPLGGRRRSNQWQPGLLLLSCKAQRWVGGPIMTSMLYL
jgi:hypothetical protein